MYPQNSTPLQAIAIALKYCQILHSPPQMLFYQLFVSIVYANKQMVLLFHLWQNFVLIVNFLDWVVQTLPGPYSFISDLNPWPLVTSACAFLCAVFQTKTTISQWLLSELFFGQISGSCVTNFSILPISICTSHSPSSRYSQDSPGSATAGAAQD